MKDSRRLKHFPDLSRNPTGQRFLASIEPSPAGLLVKVAGAVAFVLANTAASVDVSDIVEAFSVTLLFVWSLVGTVRSSLLVELDASAFVDVGSSSPGPVALAGEAEVLEISTVPLLLMLVEGWRVVVGRELGFIVKSA